MKSKTLGLLAFAALALAQTGCMKRTILTFEDQEKFGYTSAEILETHNYWVMRTVEHRFVMCKDTGSQLVCTRSCGDSKDIQCPKGGLTTLVGATTNVR